MTTTHTLKPVVTGQSILAIKYKDGILMAADTLLCYGSMKKFKDVSRLLVMQRSKTVLGVSGEYSDMQHLAKLLNDLEVADFVDDTNPAPHHAREILSYLSRVFYRKRNDFDPLWNQIAVAGLDADGALALGYVDLHGTAFYDNYVATGFGAYFALPLLREAYSPDMSEADARALLLRCMTILFARVTQAHNSVQIAKVTTEGVTVEDPVEVHPQWNFHQFTRPSLGADLCALSW